MKSLSRLAGLTIALLVTVVALSGTAYAKLPPEDPDPIPPVYDASQPAVVVESGLSALQVIGLMLAAAVVAAVLTVVAERLVPRLSHAAS
jgi:hypothetical protein